MQLLRIAVLALAAVSLAAPAETRPKPKTRHKPDAVQVTKLTGCIDQEGEVYVLTRDGMSNKVELRGRAFSDDNFARYVGNKAAVEGELEKDAAGRETIHVTRLDKVADTCR